MITVTLNSDEMRDVVYALQLAEDAITERGIKTEWGEMKKAAARVTLRIATVRNRIEANASAGHIGGRCVHGVAYAVPCVKCLGILKGE